MAHFRTKARSVATAISELWKNGYDAYADNLQATLYEAKYHARFSNPMQNYGISLREVAHLQTFPLACKFLANTVTAISRLIGDAVSSERAKRVAKFLIK